MKFDFTARLWRTWNRKSRVTCLATIMLIAVFVHDPCWSQQPARAILADASPVEASGLTLEEEGRLILQTNDGPQRIDAAELVAWGTFREIRRRSGIVIGAPGGTDSETRYASLLAGDITAIEENELNVSSDVFTPIVLKRSNVLGMVCRWSADSRERDQLLNRISREKRVRDLMWMSNGDELTGHLAPAKVLTGELADLRILPNNDSSPVTVAIDNVVAVGLESPTVKSSSKEQPIAAIGLRDGSFLWVTDFTLFPTQTEIAVLNGPTLFADSQTFWPNVTGMQWIAGRVTYVSDMPIAGFKHIPFLSTEWNYGVDRSDLDGLLRDQQGIVPKGIGMHSTSRLAFDLDNRFRRFEADVAVDDVAGRMGSVVFRVFVERSTANATEGKGTSGNAANWKVIYTSPIVRGGDPPVPVSVDVSRATRMALVVDFADRGDEGDHANWLQARLLP